MLGWPDEVETFESADGEARWHLSDKTVETHVRSIFTKLDLAPDDNDHRRVLAVLAFLRSS